MKNKVTIIIPVYNTEKFLEKCLDSVLRQTYKNFEIIVINDGSTDTSLKILKNYQKNDKRLKIIDITNHGQGYARNLALSKVESEFVMFVDADDIIDENTIEKALNKIIIDDSDFVFYRWQRFRDKTGELIKEKRLDFFNKKILTERQTLEMLTMPFYYTVTCLYRTEFLNNNNIRYSEKHIYEDKIFWVKVAINSNKISILDEPLYFVRANEESTTGGNYGDGRHARDYILAVKSCVDELNKAEYNKQYSYYYEYALNRFLLYHSKRIPHKFKKKFRKDFVDIMSKQKIESGSNKFTKLLIRLNIFSKKRYFLFFLMILSKKFLKLIRLILVKLKNITLSIISLIYYKKSRINKKLVVFESKNSTDFASNMFYLAKEINENYSQFKIKIILEKNIKEKVKKLLQNYNIKNIELVTKKSIKYYKVISTAKYLFTDSTFGHKFIKKDGQIITNTWHGTPLKKMGRDNFMYELDNVQRTLLFSNYLIYPNNFMKKILLDSYMIRNIYNGKILDVGYPRNSVFFDTKRSKEVRNQLNLNGKEIIIYMPTWRGYTNEIDNENQINVLKFYFDELDKKLKDNQILYISLHVFVGKQISCENYKHIKNFPDELEKYDFLNIADCLVTDYSSVFFDFACSGKKIILFAYDQEEYLNQRGIYINFNELPFSVAKTVDELLCEINNKEHTEYKEFMKDYCTYDELKSTQKICRYIFENEDSTKSIVDNNFENKKKNILFYLGENNFYYNKNVFTKIFESVDYSKVNYYFMIDYSVIKLNEDFFKSINKEINFIPFKSKYNDINLYNLFQSKANINKIRVDYIFKDVSFDYIINGMPENDENSNVLKSIKINKEYFEINSLNNIVDDENKLKNLKKIIKQVEKN